LLDLFFKVNMKNLFIVFLSAILFFVFISKFNSPKNVKEEKVIKEISFSFVGDLMCHSPIYESSRIQNDSFDFNPIFNEIKNDLSKADFTIGNLETVIAGDKFIYSGYPNFNSPIEFLDAIKNAGFDILITCNNHSLDKGTRGLINTINNINKLRLKNIGTN